MVIIVPPYFSFYELLTFSFINCSVDLLEIVMEKNSTHVHSHVCAFVCPNFNNQLQTCIKEQPFYGSLRLPLKETFRNSNHKCVKGQLSLCLFNYCIENLDCLI